MNRRTRSLISRASLVESLERRTLLSLSTIGGEFQVNSFFTNAQNFPSIASDADGDTVAVWQSTLQDGSSYGIYAKRYNAGGIVQGSEFRVNTTTANAQFDPTVAMDADGDFVVVWNGNGPGDNAGIMAQRYNAAGVAQGGEFRVNMFTTGGQGVPALAMDSFGNFVVAWESNGQDGSQYGVYARRYSAGGAPQGAEFRVNTFTTNSQRAPAAAMDADGDFAIAWYSSGQSGASDDIYAQRYNSAGATVGGEFPVNTFTTSGQSTPAIAMDSSGDFVVTWDSSSQDGSYLGTYGQRYNAAGAQQGSEFRVNTFTTGNQFFTRVAMDADGDFLITWMGSGIGDTSGVFAQHFNAAGVAQGTEFRVNTFTTGSQLRVAVAIDADGDAVPVWESSNQDGSGYGVYAQRYDESTETAGPVLSGLAVELNPIAAGERVVQSVPALVLNFSEELSTAGGSGGINSAINPANYILTRNGQDVSSLITSAIFGFNVASRKYQTTLNFSAPLTDGNYVVTARQALRDPAGNALDGNLDGAPGGGDASIAFSVRPPVNIGPEVRANVFTTGAQDAPAVAADAAGNYVVVWQSLNQDGSSLGIYAQRYNAAGQPLGGEFRVNSFTTGFQTQPAIAMEANGDFVVTWGGNGTGDTSGIFARRYNSAGTPLAGEFLVNTTTTDGQGSGAVAMDTDGDFVIAWDGNGVGDDRGIYARRFNNAGVAQGNEFRVNTHTPSTQQSAAIGMDADGDFVVGWSSYLQDGSSSGAYAQRYSADGVAQGADFRVNTITVGAQAMSSVAMYPGGEFLILWRDSTANPDSDGLYLQRYSATGQTLGGAPRVHTAVVGTQDRGVIAVDASGDFVVAWRSVGQDAPGEPTNGGIYAQRFNALGATQGPEFRVNTVVTGSQTDPAVSLSATGDFIVAWCGNGTGDADGVFAQRYFPNVAPTTSGIPAVNVPQDAPDTVIQLRNSFDDSTDPDNQLVFSVVGNSNPALFTSTSVQNALGTLTLDYAPGQGGQSTLTIRCTDTGGLFVETSFLVTVTPAFAVSGSQFLFETAPHRFNVTFNRDIAVGTLGPDDLSIMRLPAGSPFAATSVTYDVPTRTATFTLATNPLADGDYRATIVSGDVDDSQGNPLASTFSADFFVLAGDANRDRSVNSDDFNIFVSNFGFGGRTFSQGNFNYDPAGLVGSDDFNILASSFGHALSAGTFARRPILPAGGQTELSRLLDELNSPAS